MAINNGTLDLSVTFNDSDWCSPSIGVYQGCLPEYRIGYTIHNWSLAIPNLLAAAVLTIITIVRLFVTRRKADSFFVAASFTIYYNIFIALWCILREIESSPHWVTGLMFSLAQTCIVAGINYMLLVYVELQTVENMLVYDGLRVYKRTWIVETILNFIASLFYPISAASTSYVYSILARFHWATFGAIMIRIFSRGLYYGLKIRHITRVNRMVVCLAIISLAGVTSTLLATISPILIDRVIWLYHGFFGIMEGAVLPVNALLCWWSVSVTQVSIRENSSKSRASSSSGSKSSKLSGESGTSIPL